MYTHIHINRCRRSLAAAARRVRGQRSRLSKRACAHVCVCMYYIYIYIYRERERCVYNINNDHTYSVCTRLGFRALTRLHTLVRKG